jgi:type II secretory pathway pseudopilin PulG
MSLRGQGTRQAGYAMAALLVALAVMAVMMSVALPVWRQEARRQKEDELVWRGTQYVRAIRMYTAKMGGALPPSYDALLQGHFLRKKYKDPITNDDFEPLGPATAQPGLAPGRGQSQPGRGGQPLQPPPGFPVPQSPSMPTTSMPTTSALSASSGSVPGGLIGVRSKSKDESIRIYNGRTHYNEWVFMYVSQQPGGPGRGGPQRGGPGGPGGPGRGPNGGTGPILGPNGQPLPFPPGGNRGGRGPGTAPPPQFPPGFPPGRRGGGL